MGRGGVTLKYVGLLLIISPTMCLNKRLVRYVNIDPQCFGFIPDVYKLLQKYDLLTYLQAYFEDGLFPPRRQWKSIVERSVERRANDDITRRLQASDQWGVTVNVVERDNCSPLWRVARDNPRHV